MTVRIFEFSNSDRYKFVYKKFRKFCSNNFIDRSGSDFWYYVYLNKYSGLKNPKFHQFPLRNRSLLFKFKYWINKSINQKTVRHIHSLHIEVWWIRSKTLVTHSYIYADSLLFTIKMTKNTSFLMIFMIKTVGGVNIPPGISISIHDNGTLRVEIETPDFTDWHRNFIISIQSILKDLFSQYFTMLLVNYT